MKNIIFCAIVISLLSLFQLGAFAQNYEIYDIHQHYVPECYKQVLLLHGKKGAESDGLPTPVWSVEDQLKTMNDLGIKVAFLSLAAPHPYWDDKNETIKLVRQINFSNFIRSQKEKLNKTKLLTKKQKKKVYKDNFELLFGIK